MSYRSRLYNHRNAKSAETEANKPFFSKQHETNNTKKKNAFFQAKLAVNEPGDQYEHEADSVANTVVNNKSARQIMSQKKISSVQRLATSMEDEKLGTNDARMERAKEYPEKEKDRMVQKMTAPEKEKDKKVQMMAAPEKEKDKKVQMMAAPEKEKDKKVQMMAAPEKDKEKKVQKMAAPEKEKDKMVQKMGMPEKEKDKMVQKMAAPEKDKEKKVQKMHDPEKEEGENALAAPLQKKSDGGGSTASPQVSSKIESSAGKGNKLPAKTMHEMSSSFGADFGDVRVHHDNEAEHLNKELNAQAFTHGSDIYFNSGKYDTNSSEGKKLLAHELTHVVQQKEKTVQNSMIQPKLEKSMPVRDGVFEIGMTDVNGANATPPTTFAQMKGTINFMPNTAAPYSNEIKLFQIIKFKDTKGANGSLFSVPPGRGPSLRTTEDAATGVKGDFMTDVYHQSYGASGPTTVADPGSQLGLDYPGGSSVYGFKRSSDIADIKAAELTDAPATSGNMDYEFETVAKGEDTNEIYGSLHWGFDTRNGKVANEFAFSDDSQSATFEAAAEKHRDFYVHEPVIFYFEYDDGAITTTEANKIDLFLDYLNRFKDVMISLEGYADHEGDKTYNGLLSLNRAESVKDMLISKGVKESRIHNVIAGFGSTEQFTSGSLAPNSGRSQDLEANRRGNRRVVLTFEHTTSTKGP